MVSKLLASITEVVESVNTVLEKTENPFSQQFYIYFIESLI